jgi:type I restriction enzyme S subunit
MRSETSFTTLDEAILLQRGFDLPAYARESGVIPVVASTGIAGYHSTYKAKPPGVVIGRSGSIGGGQYLTVPFWPLNTTLWVKDFRGNDPRYVYYLLRSIDFTRLNAGSGVPTLNRNHLKGIPVWVPSPAEQQRIAIVLAALDDRIASNNRVGRLLEEAVATVFRARFVDFVGVEEFKESEVGSIPKEWHIGSIYDVAKVTYGRPFKSSLFNVETGTPLIRIRDLPKGQPSVATPEVRTDARLVRRGDIVVGMDGEFRAYSWSGPDAWLNQRVCVFDPHDHISHAFVLEAIKRPLAFFEATKGGTTVIHLGKRDIDTVTIALPPTELMSEFATTADPLVQLAVELRWESRTLGAIRDTLLPKLISGEIRVPDTDDPDEVIGPAAEQLAQAAK